MLVIPGQMVLAHHHLWARHHKALFRNEPMKWPDSMNSILFFYTATVCGYCAYSFFTNSEKIVEHAWLEEICCRARPTDRFRYGHTWIGIVQQLKMTFSVHINMEVEVSLYNLKRRIFFESCQSYSRIFQLIPNVIRGCVKALLHCVITFSSSTFQIQKHACARVCVCTRVYVCVCVLSHTGSAWFRHSGEEDFIWLNGLSLSRQRLARLQPQSVMWNNRRSPRPNVPRRPGTCCRAEVGVECEGLLISNQSRKPPASGVGARQT